MNSFHEIMCAARRPMRMYFVRHGESEGNRRGIMQGHYDAPLTELGREQAQRAGEWFRGQQVRCGAVLASPLSRATDTARALSAAAAWPNPVAEPSLSELDTGVFERLSFVEIQERYPAEYAEFLAQSWESVPEAESVASLTARALASWQALVEAGNGIPGDDAVQIAAVSHGGMLQWIFKASTGATVDAGVPWMPLIKASNCGISAFDVRPVRTTSRTGEPMRWYYGQWSMINRTPWDPEAEGLLPDDQFATRAGGDTAR